MFNERSIPLWESVYVAAVAAGAQNPKAVAQQALEDHVAVCDAKRAHDRLGPTRPYNAEREQIEHNIKQPNWRKIFCIKALREAISGMGLREAKAAVEMYHDHGQWPTNTWPSDVYPTGPTA